MQQQQHSRGIPSAVVLVDVKNETPNCGQRAGSVTKYHKNAFTMKGTADEKRVWKPTSASTKR